MSALLHPVTSQISQVILGKQQQIKLTIACLLARGHLLIEDLPGVGKTTLAHALARTLGLEFQRMGSKVRHVERAKRITTAFEKAGTGLVVVDGKLVEKPVLRSMARVLAIAKRIGSDSDRLA